MSVTMSGYRGYRLLLVALVVAGVSACQTTPAGSGSAVAEIDAALEEGIESQPSGAAEPPEAVASALLPRIELDTAVADEESRQRFEIRVKDAPAQEFFMSLVEGTPFNMVVHPDVSGAITLNLKNVTIPEVMEIVRNVYGYEFERTSYGYEVLPARLRSRIYQVDFPNMQRSGSSQTRVSTGQVSDVDRDTLQREEEGLVTRGTSDRGSVSGTRIDTVLPETSFWQELQSSLRAILADAPGRTVVVNPQSGIVVVRAMPQELREVEAFLEQIQASAVRQVILEAKILEVELNERHQQGVNWAGLLDLGDETATFGQTGGGSVIGDGESIIAGNQGNLDPEAFAPIVGTAASAFGGVFTVALALDSFNAFIELLETQGTVHVLSSPRVATLNNQKAVIKVGSDEFFVTDVSSTTVTGTTTTTTPSVELTPFFSGIALDVTPQISEGGKVILHVHPSISEVVDQQKTITVGSVTQTLPLALSTVRESDTIVQAESGQVVVIGGLMENRFNDDSASTPGLGQAPVLGPLFRQQRQTASKSELVILLRPIVVEGGAQWARVMRESRERIGSMRRPRDGTGGSSRAASSGSDVASSGSARRGTAN